MSKPSAMAPLPEDKAGLTIGLDEVDDAADTGPLGVTTPSRPRELIGKYEVVSLLGRGGMGAVYQAFDPILERDVAVKMMLPQIAEDPEQKQRFEREARAIARITHSNVVTVFDLGYHTDGAPYIVMELLVGQDLLQLMSREPPLPFSQKISIVSQVLAGLGQAHKLGIVHRDIKPANVSLTADGDAKIMDFGIAHLASTSVTAEGSIMGTAAYMSPEQARGEGVDGRSDLFSVGSLLCELVTGKQAFEAESIMATLYAIGHNEPRIELPPGPEYERLRPILERALAKKRDERYQTSAEFATALVACLDDSGALAARKEARPSATGGSGLSAKPPMGSASTAGDSSGSSRLTPRSAAKASTGQPANPTRLFRLLRDIYVGGKSGHLHFTAGRSCRSLRIFKGQILYGTSDADGEHLGDVLVRYGMITEADRLRAVQKVLQERRRLGESLVGDGLLEQERLEEALGLHVREILFTMLEGGEGSHSFEETAEEAPELAAVCPLSSGEVILEATRYVQDPALVREVLGDTGRKLALSTDPMLRSQRITLTPTDGFVMSRVDGTLTARDVLSLSPVSPEDTERSLFGLLCTGVIDYLEPVTRPKTSPPSWPSTRPLRAPTARTRPLASQTRPSETAPLRSSTTPLFEGAPPPRVSAPTDPPGDSTIDAAAGGDPAVTLREAEGLFAQQAYWDVIQRVEPLLRHTRGLARTRAVLLLARAYMKNPHWQKRAEQALLRLVQDDPACTPAYHFLGQIYAGQNLTSRAQAMYRKVLEVEPEHQAAQAELRKLTASAEDGRRVG
jgi:serine/threonine protein kinase